MKIKNIKITLLILTSLVTLSFAFFVTAQKKSNTNNNVFLDSDQDGLTDAEEKLYGTNPHNPDTDGDGYSDGAEIKSGYNPLKPAPNDKLTSPLNKSLDSQASSVAPDQKNLTQKVAQKISQLSDQTNPSNDNQVSLKQIKDLVSQSLTDNTSVSLPTDITKKDIKIKKENFSGMSKDKIQKKKKEDFINYITAVFYILSSNSPKPLTSSSDITSVTSQIVQEITNAITLRDTKSIKNLNQSGKKILEQLKDLEVPQDLVDIDLKALRFAEYAQNMEQYIKPTNDPLSDIVNFSKMNGLIENLLSFSQDVQHKFSEYGITYNSDIKNKLKDYGLNITDGTLIKDLLNNSTSQSSQ